MPVILRTPEEIETWLTAPTEEALKVQRPVPDGSLTVVATGEKEDPPPALVGAPRPPTRHCSGRPINSASVDHR
jgi:hypothetical protein